MTPHRKSVGLLCAHLDSAKYTAICGNRQPRCTRRQSLCSVLFIREFHSYKTFTCEAFHACGGYRINNVCCGIWRRHAKYRNKEYNLSCPPQAKETALMKALNKHKFQTTLSGICGYPGILFRLFCGVVSALPVTSRGYSAPGLQHATYILAPPATSASASTSSIRST